MYFNPEFKKRLVAALRSGEYKQNTRRLRSDNGFCCLGVACDIFDPNGWKEVDGGWVFESYLAQTAEHHDEYEYRQTAVLPANVAMVTIAGHCGEMCTDFKLDREQSKAAHDFITERSSVYKGAIYSDNLAFMNDSGALTFHDIADFIEAHC